MIPKPFYQSISSDFPDQEYLDVEKKYRQKHSNNWKNNSKKYLKQISNLTIKYSSIGIDWGFNKNQVHLLWQYYDVYLIWA